MLHNSHVYVLTQYLEVDMCRQIKYFLQYFSYDISQGDLKARQPLKRQQDGNA